MYNYKKYCCRRKDSIRMVLKRLEETHKKTIVVLEDNDVLCGTVTDGDVRRYLLTSDNLNVSVERIMSTSPIFLHVNEIGRAQECMNENLIDAVPIVDDKGIIYEIVFRYDEFIKNSQEETGLNVPVVIMAGGKGSRLFPYTNILPKPLLPMQNRTILECVIDTFYRSGSREFTLILNYKKEIVKAYLSEIDHDYTVKYIEEDSFMGTGGGLFYLKRKINSTFIVSNCDVMLDINYKEVLEKHQNDKDIITIIAANQTYHIPYGTIQVDNTGAIVKLKEKPDLTFLVNTGVYIIEPVVLEYLEKKYYNMTDIIEEMIRDGKRVGIYAINENDWTDVGEINGLINSLQTRG